MSTDSRPPISEKTPVRTSLGVWILVFITAIGWGVNIGITAKTISAHGERITALELKTELLGRIDERTANMQRQLDKLTK